MRMLFNALAGVAITVAGVTVGTAQETTSAADVLAETPTTKLADAPVVQSGKPNIVLIFADDMGYGDLSCYGQEKYKTPHLDQMAAEGVRLTDFYVASPACSPSRASLLTGQYPMRTGVPNVLGQKSMTGIHPDAPLLPEVLKDKGYATAIVGKWHLGHLPEFMPLENGFDQFLGLPYSNDMEPAPLFRDKTIIEPEAKQETLTHRYTGEALAFIDKSAKAGKPFFLYFAHTFPHVPLHVNPKIKGTSGAGLYGDVMTEIDLSVGAVLQFLQQKGLEKNTLVIFTSDNGPWLIKGKNAGFTGGLRGSKGTDYEGGVRVPFIAWWPGKLPAGKVIDIPAISLDIMPTLVRLTSDVPSTAPTLAKLDATASLPKAKYDGVDIWAVLTEGESVGERTFFFPDYYVRNQVGAVRRGDYKLLVARDKTGKHDARTTELFNLKDDPFEKHDLSERHPDMVAELGQLADQMRTELEASNPWGPRLDEKSNEALKYVIPPSETADKQTTSPNEGDDDSREN